MEETLRPRCEIPESEKWDLTLLYQTESDYENDLIHIEKIAARLTSYKDTLNDAQAINECLRLYAGYMETRIVLVCYASMHTAADCTDTSALEREASLNALLDRLDSELTFIESELSVCPETVLDTAAKNDAAQACYLQNILRARPHRLHPEAEHTLSAFNEIMQTPYTVYEQMKLSDIVFEPFTVNGKAYPLDYSLYEDSYEYDARTEVRRAAFHAFSRTIARYENTTACVYNAEIRRQNTEARLRGFSDVFESLLFEQHVTREMYDRQIDMIMERLSVHMRRYANLIKRSCNLDTMTFADLKAPLDPGFEDHIELEDAKATIREALSVMGEDYLKTVDAAFNEHWIDFARNIGKSTGGFCDSPYGKNSYILMTWNGRMSDMFTLAHELGHAGHFALCNSSRSVFDTDVSTYFVESPSTMNELLLGHHLLKKAKDKRTRRYILSRMIGDTYFHNCVTHLIEAAYQREAYRIIDRGGSVHAQILNKLMGDTLRKFWGDTVLIDEDAEHTWMRQPHYYMGLYSYTYSAGLTISTLACERILKEGKPAVEDWKRVLSTGSTLDPVGLAKLAGVDITNDAALIHAIDTIGKMIDELESLSVTM